ncbi:MAG: hypothetical protein GX663_02765 [Clostridiales bacterium]|nr:hypothetical protein [Clostridiales bacterium]
MVKKTKYSLGNFPLIKIKSKELIEKTQKGSFYMNSLKKYREMYLPDSDDDVADPYEGKFFVKEAYLCIPERDECKLFKNHLFGTNYENDFVFCMFGIHPELQQKFNFTEEQQEKLIKIGDTTLIITDPYEFRNRIANAALAEGYEVRDGFVKYYDENVDDVGRIIMSLRNETKDIVFYKRNKYKYQQEYRFTIKNITGEKFLELDIGDISDISEILTTERFLNAQIISE